MIDPLLRLDATAQLEALAARKIGAEELLDASLAVAERLGGALNAVIARDVERARRDARAYDDRRAGGEGAEAFGPLAGLPMTVKDTLDVEGLPAVSGLPAYKGRTSAQDAVAVARARQAGAVIWGKTNAPPLAGDWQTDNPVYGRTQNPWDLQRTPGGSSGGAAAALASFITSLEIGSDIGGSLRVPASFCGVYAHKPTYGLVSTRGHVPPAPGMMAPADLGVAGPMARSVRDLRLLLSVIADAPPSLQPPADLKTTRIAVWLDDPFFALDPEVRSAIEDFAKRIAAQGATVETIESPIDGEALYAVYMTLLLPLVGAAMPKSRRAFLAFIRPLLGMMGGDPRSAPFLLRQYIVTHAEWLKANEQRFRFKAFMQSQFERYDVILAPTAPVAAFPHDDSKFELRKLRLSTGRAIAYTEMLDWSGLATVCGLPATAIPAGATPGGLPVGVQLIGPVGGDGKTLAIAEAIETQISGFVSPDMNWAR